MENKELAEFIVDSLTKNSEDISDIKVTMARNTESLIHHVARTDELQKHVLKIEGDVEPLKKHVQAVNVIFKICAALACMVGALAAILNIISFF